jgi:iron complex outermembrane receptor protein
VKQRTKVRACAAEPNGAVVGSTRGKLEWKLNSPLGLLLSFVSAAGVCFAQQAPAPPRETVVVTGTYEPVSLDEVDRAVTVLRARDEALLFSGLAGLLKLDPSLDLRQRAPGGVQADLSIRGSGFGQTLVMINGIRMNDAQSAHHNMDIPLPVEAVSRIEVMRGSGSTIYGSDAVAGAINIIAEPPEKAEFRLRTAFGSFGTNVQHGVLAGSAGPFSEQLSFAREFSSGFRPGRDYRSLQLASTTHLATGIGPGDLTLAYMDHPFGADQFYGNFNSWEDTKTWLVAGQQALGERTTASFAYRRHSDLFVLYRDRPSVFTNRHAVESGQAALRRREPVAPAVTVSYGVEALHESIASSNLGDHRRSRAAAYAAVDFRALRRFSLSLAAREEVFRSFSGEFCPTIAGGVWLSSRWKLRASASRAFRVPSYTDLYYHDPGNLGNPNLRPEQAWGYEGGFDWNPGGRVRGELTVFTRRERDGIDYYRAAANDVWRALNIQNLHFTGVEASVRLAPVRGQTIDLRYTALHAAQDTVPLGYTRYSFSYPKHSGVAEWRADLPAGLLFRTRLGVLDRYARNPYALWEFSAVSSRGRVHPFFQVANIANARYEEVAGVAMPGRSVLGGIELVWRGR